jgi:hypothetical protein
MGAAVARQPRGKWQGTERFLPKSTIGDDAIPCRVADTKQILLLTEWHAEAAP